MKSQKTLTYLLGQTMKLVKFRLGEKFKEKKIELNAEQYIAMHYINENNSPTQQDLANHFMRDKSIVLRQMNTLIDLDYVERKQDEHDKRKKNLHLTAKGKEFLELTRELSVEISEELLKDVSAKELANFENVLFKIQQNTGFKDCLSGC
jgi:DNA-binding MarR family transcriptional regulator